MNKCTTTYSVTLTTLMDKAEVTISDSDAAEAAIASFKAHDSVRVPGGVGEPDSLIAYHAIETFAYTYSRACDDTVVDDTCKESE